MSFRDILVQVDESPQSAIRTEVAAALAARSDARLTGLFLKSSFIKQFLAAVPFSYLPPADLEALIDQHTAAVNSAAEATRANFEQVARDAGVIAEWLSVDGELDGVVERCARQFDLTVLPPEFKLASSHRQISADHVALASGFERQVEPQS